jgi:hypothetical protein
MRNLLPIPSIDSFPSAFRGDEDIVALTDFLDAEYQKWFDDSANLERLKDPARCPAVCLNAFGEMLAAGLRDEDTEQMKRRKISTAIKNLKLRGTWLYSVKVAIDSRVGGDSKLISKQGIDDFILCGTGSEPDGYLWSILGGEDATADYGIALVAGAGEIITETDTIGLGADQAVFVGITEDDDSFVFGGLDDAAPYGVRMLGDGTEVTTTTSPYVDFRIKGTIAIDIDNAFYTDAQVETLVRDLLDLVPCYFKIYLGYMDGDQFVPYASGIIG